MDKSGRNISSMWIIYPSPELSVREIAQIATHNDEFQNLWQDWKVTSHNYKLVIYKNKTHRTCAYRCHALAGFEQSICNTRKDVLYYATVEKGISGLRATVGNLLIRGLIHLLLSAHARSEYICVCVCVCVRRRQVSVQRKRKRTCVRAGFHRRCLPYEALLHTPALFEIRRL